jgi:uncharacterized membrane protein YesL
MEMNGLMGGLYRVTEWIMRLVTINLLWIICSLPFAITVFSLLLGTANVETGFAIKSVLDLISWMIVPLIVAPFCLFPASAALCTVVRKWVMGYDDVPLFKTFFRGFKTNYKQAMLGGIFFSIILIILLVNVHFYTEQGGYFSIIKYVFFVMILMWLVSVMNYLAMLTHFEMKTRTLFKNSILFTLGRPLNSLLMLVCNGIILYVSFTKFSAFLVVFFMGSIMGVFSFWSFYKELMRIQEKEEQQKSKEA